MFIKMRLEWIDDNPFQTRQVYDPAAILELAESIAGLWEARPETMGLIQVPPARAIDGAGEWKQETWSWEMGQWSAVRARLLAGELRIQLAAGHSRLRAFRLLAEEDPAAWSEMPLDLADLDDQAMADVAWAENQKRRDLTAIEEAKALQAALERFGWTQREVGERWGLSQSAVANKLRLLHLPGSVQAMVMERRLTERHARALLPLVQVAGRPAGAAVLANRAVNRHQTAEDLGRDVQDQVRKATQQVRPVLLDFDDWGRVELAKECAAVCRGCEHFVANKRLCRRPMAYRQKWVEYEEWNLAQAASATGLPVVPPSEAKALSPAALSRARAHRCENLGVAQLAWVATTAVQVEGREGVYYVCREGFGCECSQRATAAEAEQNPDSDAARAKIKAAWRKRQEKQAQDILAGMEQHLQGAFRGALRYVGRDDLALFLALVKRIDSQVQVSLDADRIADALGALLTRGRFGYHAVYQGQVLVHRAQTYQLAGMGTAMQETEAHLVVIRDEIEEMELGNMNARWTHHMEKSRDRARDILAAYRSHPDHDRLQRELDSLVATIEAMISGEMGGDDEAL